jgi:hypothetical protein
VTRCILHHPTAECAKANAFGNSLFGAKRSRRHAGLSIGFKQDKPRQTLLFVPTEISTAYTATPKDIMSLKRKL